MSTEAITPARVYTVGHSTHAIDDFLGLLRMQSAHLAEAGISYEVVHIFPDGKP